MWHYSFGLIRFQLTGDGCGCSLEDVLIFFSGADRVPPLGFPQSPSLSFLDVGAIFPTASTCSLQLRLPTQYTDYNEFINALKEALFCNGGLDGGPRNITSSFIECFLAHVQLLH